MAYRILVINWNDPTNPQAGGAEVNLREIFGRIAAAGHQVRLLASGYPGAEPEGEIDGIRVLRRGRRATFNYVVPPVYLTRLKREGFDIVIDDLNKLPFFSPLFAGRPVLALEHHLFGTSIYQETSRPAATYVYLFERLIPLGYRRTPFVAVSKSTRDDLIRLGIDAGRIRIIHNCVDHDTFKPLDSTDPSGLQILFFGRIKKYKRLDILLRAMPHILKEVPEARLVVVGDGDHLPCLKKLAAELSIEEACEFAGHLSGSELVRAINQSRLVATTSVKEGWGLTVLEANACGVPVVASDVPGLRDAVRHNQTGLLVPFGEVEPLVGSVVRLLLDRPERDRLAGGALRWARSFNWDQAADLMLEAIDDTVREWRKHHA